MKILDKNFNPIYELDDYQSLIWHEKYYGCGEIEIHVPKMLEGAYYIYNNDLKETAIIESYKRDSTKVVYKGSLLKALLRNRIVSIPTLYANKTAEFIAKDLVTRYGGQNIKVAPTKNLGTSIEYVQLLGENLLEYIDTLLCTQELGCYIYYDYLTAELIFDVFKGEDNTINKRPLSKDFETILDATYSEDMKSYKNFAYVGGEQRADGSRLVVPVDRRTNPEEPARELWVDAAGVRKEILNPDGSKTILTDAQYRQALISKGIEELSGYNISDQIDIINQETLELGEKRVYKDDYVITEQRVVEIMTGYEKGGKKQVATFGKPRKRKEMNNQ